MPEDGGEVSLYTLGSAGEDLQKVWSLGQARVFQVCRSYKPTVGLMSFPWSPDGSAILFASSAGEVVVVSLDIRAEGLFGRGIGGAFNALTVAPREFPGGVLARAAGRWAEWAPDGQKIGILTSLYHYGKIDTARQDELYTVSRVGALKRVLVRRTASAWWQSMPVGMTCRAMLRRVQRGSLYLIRMRTKAWCRIAKR